MNILLKDVHFKTTAVASCINVCKHECDPVLRLPYLPLKLGQILICQIFKKIVYSHIWGMNYENGHDFK